MVGRGGRQPDRIRPPDPEGGPFAELALGLYELYETAGRPSTRELAAAGQLVPASVKKILEGTGRWKWDTGRRMIRVGLRGEPIEEWHRRWQEADARQNAIEADGRTPPLPWVDVADPQDDAAANSVEDWSVGRGGRARSWRVLGRVRRIRTALRSLSSRGQDTTLRRREVALRAMRAYAEDLARPSRAHGSPLATNFTLYREPVAGMRMRHRGLGELDREQEPGGGFTIRGLFDDAAETLVIVSGAGLGKTTQLAELAGDLAEACLQELRTDPPPGGRLRPLPVLLSLATYRGGALEEWLTAEVNRTHDIATDQVREWLRHDEILPLLDGLDEVPEDVRRRCAEELRAFRERSTGIVVACRDRDLRLARTLGARHYAVIEPPHRKQVQQYLAQHAESLSAVRTALESDESLWRLLRSPLMLGIVHDTYYGRENAPELQLRQAGQARTRSILDAYVSRMLGHRASSYPARRTIEYLTWLGRTLSARGLNTLHLDRLDETWAEPRHLALLRVGPKYVVQFSAAALTTAWLGVAFATGVLPDRIAGQASNWLLVVFGYMALASALSYRNVRRMAAAEKRVAPALPPVLFAGTAAAAPTATSCAFIVLSATAWAMASVTGGLAATGKMPFEQLRWSWRPAPFLPWGNGRLGVLLPVFAALWDGFFFAAFGTVSFMLVVPAPAAHPWLRGAAIATLFCYAMSGDNFEVRMQDQRPRPNEGIRRSARFALQHGAVVCLGMVAMLGAVPWWFDPSGGNRAGWFLGALFGATFGFVRACRYGGLACIYHWLIRYALARSGDAPLRYLRFLRDAEQRILLRRVGSGFSFPHRLLQEHFAVPCDVLLARVTAGSPR